MPNTNETSTTEEKQPNETVELLRLSQPIYFEPISSLTNVFFDQDNQQIFCVRSNGVKKSFSFF